MWLGITIAYDSGQLSLFSQLQHLTDHSKFDQTNLLYIINGEVNYCVIGKQMSRQFSILQSILGTDIQIIELRVLPTLWSAVAQSNQYLLKTNQYNSYINY